MAQVLARLGNIFEGGSDLTVLPCSAKGTVTTATRRWLELFAIPAPSSLSNRPRLGEVSDLIVFPGDKNITRFVVFGASVLNDFSDTATLFRIGSALGRITVENRNISIVEAPLLGTGAGGLPAVASARALCEGFLSSALEEASLYLFVFDAERLRSIQSAMNQRGFLMRLWESISLRPGMAGVSIDLKQLVKRRD